MLRQLGKLAQAAQEAVSSTSRDSNNDSNSFTENDDAEVEGFLCPECRAEFQDVESLQTHFTNKHINTTAVNNPNFEENTANGLDPSHSMDELRKRLEEETKYSSLLKEELQRLQSTVANANHLPEGEVPLLVQQINMLEASKALATQRYWELEKENAQLSRSFNTRMSAANEKINSLESEMQNDRSRIKEFQKDNSCAKDEQDVLRKQLEDKEKKVLALEQTLKERPSREDLDVLQETIEQLRKSVALGKESEAGVVRQLREELKRTKIELKEKEQERVKLVEDGHQRSASEASTLGKIEEEKVKALEQLDKEIQQKQELSEQLKSSQKKNEDYEKEVEKKSTKLLLLTDENLKLKTELEKRPTQKKVDELHKSLEDADNDFKAKLSAAEKQSEEFKNTIESLKSDLNTASEDKNKLREELSAVKVESEKVKVDLQRSHTRVECLEAELNEKSDVDAVERSRMNAERQSMEREFAKNKTLLQETIQQITDISGVVAKIEKERDELAARLDVVLKENESEQNKGQELSNKVSELEQKLKEEQENSARLTQEGTELKTAVEELYAKLEEKQVESIKFAEEATQLSTELEDLKVREQSATSSLHQFKQLVAEMGNREFYEDELRERLPPGSADMESVFSAFNSLKKEQKKVQELSDVVKDKEEELKRIASELEGATSDRSDLKTKYETLVTEHDKFVQIVVDIGAREYNQTDLNDLLTSIPSYVVIKDVLLGFNKLKDELKKESEAVLAAKAEVESFQDELKNAREEIQKKDEHFESRRKELNEQILSNQELNEDLIKQCTKLEEEMSAIKQEKKALQDKIENLILTLAANESKHQEAINCSKDEVSKALDKISQLEINLGEKSTELEGLKESLRVCCDESSETKQRLEESMKVTESCKKERDEIASALDEVREEFQVTVDAMEELKKSSEAKTADLETQLQQKTDLTSKLLDRCKLLTKQQTDAQEEVARIKTEQEAFMVKYQESTETLHKDYQSRLDDLNQQAANLERTNESLKRELELNGQLIERIRQEVEIEKQQVRNEVEEQKKAFATLQNDNIQLVKRCEVAESDVEFERERASENSRRFEEMRSTLHELGRAHQSIQIDVAKKGSRQWLDDSAAVNCTACGKGFSLTVRKHHCRICGLIFCNACSANTAKIVSNKNPVRVCDACKCDIGDGGRV